MNSPVAQSELAKPKPDAFGRAGQRYHDILKALLAAKKTAPGGRMSTASAKDFIEKRAALQEKNAAISSKLKGLFSKKPVAPRIGRSVSTTRKTNPTGSSRYRSTKDPERIQETITEYPPEPDKKQFLDTLLGKGLLIGGPLVGLGALGSPLFERLGYGMRAAAYPSLYERMRADEEATTGLAQSIGKELGKKTVGLGGDLVENLLSKATQVPADYLQGRKQQSIFDQLSEKDDVLSQAKPEDLQEAYHTMTRFAPTLATDPNAVKTFLRESALYGTGPNFMAIKQLADAERAVNPAQMMIKTKND